MSTSHLLVRAAYASEKARRVGVAVGIICGVLAIGIGYTIYLHRNNRVRHTDSEFMRHEQRRVNGGWWGREACPPETASERRERMVREARVNRGRNFEGGIEREARREREAREGSACPPMYQMPAPAYSTPPLRTQHRVQSQESTTTSPPPKEAPPAYSSPEVWGSSESQMAAQIVAAAQNDLNSNRT